METITEYPPRPWLVANVTSLGSLTKSNMSVTLVAQVGETGFAGAEGATAPETLRQKDRLP